MSVIRTYRAPHGREMRMLPVVRIGEWLYWTPFNGRPRLIVRAFGRKYVLADSAAFSQRRRWQRLATGFEVTIGRVRFSTLADR